MQGTDWNASFCEVSARRSALRWVLAKRNVFPLRAVIWAVIKSLSPGCKQERGVPWLKQKHGRFVVSVSLGSYGIT